MIRLILTSIFFSAIFSGAIAQRNVDIEKYRDLGIDIPDTISKLPVHQQNSYISRQVKRTRNRTMLELALNYSPLSFISGWYLDPFKEKDEPYILNADMYPQLAIGGEWFPTPILISPRYKVRILGEDPVAGDTSLPVRTPSYMPGGTIFFPLQKILTDQSKYVKFMSLSIFHHSNGQDGDEFDSPGIFNKYNGNFSTNYIEPAIWYRFRLGGGIPVRPAYYGARLPYSDIFGRMGYEINFATAKDLRSTYGNGHFNINLGYIRVINYNDKNGVTGIPYNLPYYAERFRILFNSSVVTGQRDLGLSKLKKRVNFEGSLNWRIKGSPNTAGMIATGYYGSDPYNIYFEDSYFYARIGISAGLFVAPRRERIRP